MIFIFKMVAVRRLGSVQTVFAILSIFEMAAATILYFGNREILFANRVCRSDMQHAAKFRQNLSASCGDIDIFQFFKMAAVCHLGFFWRHTWITNEKYSHCARFGCDRCSSFDSIKVSIFGTFGKRLFTSPKIEEVI